MRVNAELLNRSCIGKPISFYADNTNYAFVLTEYVKTQDRVLLHSYSTVYSVAKDTKINLNHGDYKTIY